ncbi:NACHT domain-containing protein [Streptomyces sp. NPDC059247]|uniref:NACHT domain-containing protein n=1 Tax=Streptomyces sp. NPDC059247 TaxID=3346790 RepID=UPI00368F2F6B
MTEGAKSATPTEMFRHMETSYSSLPMGRPRSIHEGFSVLDFELRFLALLAAATVRAAGRAPALVGRSPGLGEWTAYLRRVGQQLKECSTVPADRVGRAVTGVLNLYDQGFPGAPRGLRDLKRLRDHLSHGGPLPAGESELATLDELVQSVADTVTEALGQAELLMVEGESGEQRPSFIWGGDEVSLWPFLFMKPSGVWHLFSKFARAQPSFICFGGGSVSSSPSDEAIRAALHPLLKAQKADNGTLEYFIKDVEQDLRGFADDDSEPVYADHEQGFEYYWDKATGEGTGTQPRRDYFRLGPDNARQWRAESGWVPYSDYLRELANWQVVATRLRQKLEQMESKLVAEERDTLGWVSRELGTTRMSKVVVSDFDGSQREPACTFAELIDGVDQDLQANRGQTQVVFINGEAGIGKTRAMLDAAKTRAQEVERALLSGESSSQALFLYVRSTGQVLDSLRTVVDSAVASTRNLTDRGVKALCRNGLMTLLIDGFDELLGGVGYSDAIGSLRPWLDELGGRGVVVVSARSSYYMGQYRSSVERANEQGLPFVRHRVAAVQRWFPEDVEAFLGEYGVPRESLDQLSEHDRQLLGLPFFARAFAEMTLNSNDGEIKSNTLAERLLDKYVAREEDKLTGQGGTALMDRAELRRMFEYVAEFMASHEEREADINELQDAAEYAMDSELSSRRHLKQRLPILCGLAASSDDASVSRFRFQHELFFDQFLAGAASRYLMDGQPALFQAMLKQSPWRSATVTGVVAAAGDERVVQAITDFAPRLQNAEKQQIESTVAATNLGALWTAVIEDTGRVPGTDIVNAVFADGLDLSRVQGVNTRIVGCEIDGLVLPAVAGWSLMLRNTVVKKIRVSGASSDLAGLRGVRHSDLVELLLPNELLYRKEHILEALQRYGAEVVDAEDRRDELPLTEVLAARHYLTTMARRVEKSVILRGDHQPEDNRLKWAQEYGPDVWKRFVSELAASGLAAYENFSASGERKVRLRLKCSPAAILANDGTRVGTQEFWSRLEEIAN